jgi:hypothetical protein
VNRTSLGLVSLALLVAALACSPLLAPTVPPVFTLAVQPTPAAALPPSPFPTVQPQPTPLPSPELAATVLPTSVTSAPDPRPYYALAANVDAQAHRVAVTARIALISPDPNQLVFNLNALQGHDIFQLASLHIAQLEHDLAVTPEAQDVWLHIPIPGSIVADQPLTVTFVYNLSLPPIEPQAWGWRGTLGWTKHQINLGDWYPVLAVYQPGTGWVTHAPSAQGEYQTTVMSNFDVRLQVSGFSASPLIAGSGAPVPCDTAHCFSLAGGRFVAYTLSDKMLSQSVATSGGLSVTSVYLPQHSAAGLAALHIAADAAEVYSQTFGAYPFPTFTLVEGDFYDGMEYSGMSFVGSSYYQDYDETPRNLLTLIAAHETSHQWWHTLVGNDPALEPWLDEALATYSELIYLQAKHPGTEPWWWAYRIEAYQPQGAVNGRIYDFKGFRTYVNGVYLRGAQMLHVMRQALGDERFLSFLRQYALDTTAKIATGEDFWQAYQAVGGNPLDIQAKFWGPAWPAPELATQPLKRIAYR